MKILHTADLHLGKFFYEVSLIEDQRHVLTQILEYLHAGAFDVLIVAGDVYDRSVPPPEAVALFSWFLAEAKRLRPEAEILVIPGNHDSAARLGYGAEIFREMRLHFVTNPEASRQPVTVTKGSQSVDFFLLPFLGPGALTVAGPEGEEISLRSQGELTAEALGRMASLRRRDRPSVLVAHLFTAGGLGSDSERLFAGAAELVDPGLFADFSYVALGHLHRHQAPAGHVRYPGSPLAYSFSEAGAPKGVLAVEIGPEGLASADFLPLKPLFPVSRIEGSWESLAQGQDFEAWREHYLEISVDGLAIPANPMAALRLRYPRLMSLRLPQSERGTEEGIFPRSGPGRSIEEDFRVFYGAIGWEDSLAEDLPLFRSLIAETGA